MTCAAHQTLLPKGHGVKVNGIAIPRDVIARETQYHPARTPLQAWQAAARALVVRELLLQEARRLGVIGEPMTDGEGRRETAEEAAMRELVIREVRTPQADMATCRRYFEQNRQRFRHDGRGLPFELVADRIAEYLQESVQRRALAQYIARLAGAAHIEGVELASAEAMRVNDVAPGELPAQSSSHFINSGSDEDWLMLIGQMSRADDPGEVFRRRVLADAAPSK